MDPALLDRRTTTISVPGDGNLPERDMSIAGIDGTLAARTLSKDMSGPATRLVRIEPGWGTARRGAFTAGVELFVVRGLVSVSGLAVEQHHFVALPAGRLLAGLRAEEPTLALLVSSAPFRYDDQADGDVFRSPEVQRPAGSGWTRSGDGRLVKPITDEGHRPVVWLSGMANWEPGADWHRHQVDHEWFLLEGGMIVAEVLSGEERLVQYVAGGYAYRPARAPHAGPGTSVADAAVAVCRSPVPLQVVATRSGGPDDPPLPPTSPSSNRSI